MNAILRSGLPNRDEIYQDLRQHASSASPNSEWIAQILASWCVGQSALPDYLGLVPFDFDALLAYYFSGVRLDGRAFSGCRRDFSRMLERQDLIDYLLRESSQPAASESRWITEILVAGCLGEDHLWQDLGLWSRAELSALLALNFPGMAATNDKDMKWKKFLYKQLCAAEGIYVCRAPSCDVCSDYPHCFGPEEATTVRLSPPTLTMIRKDR